MSFLARKGMTSPEREAQRKKFWAILKNPFATKKQKRIMGFKWRFNQLPEGYRKANVKHYLNEIKKMEAMPDSEFEHFTKF